MCVTRPGGGGVDQDAWRGAYAAQGAARHRARAPCCLRRVAAGLQAACGRPREAARRARACVAACAGGGEARAPRQGAGGGAEDARRRATRVRRCSARLPFLFPPHCSLAAIEALPAARRVGWRPCSVSTWTTAGPPSPRPALRGVGGSLPSFVRVYTGGAPAEGDCCGGGGARGAARGRAGGQRARSRQEEASSCRASPHRYVVESSA